jgi:hypothetical protein
MGSVTREQNSLAVYFYIFMTLVRGGFAGH